MPLPHCHCSRVRRRPGNPHGEEALSTGGLSGPPTRCGALGPLPAVLDPFPGTCASLMLLVAAGGSTRTWPRPTTLPALDIAARRRGGVGWRGHSVVGAWCACRLRPCLQRSGVDLPLCSSRTCLHTAFMAISVPLCCSLSSQSVLLLATLSHSPFSHFQSRGQRLCTVWCGP